MVAQIKTAVQNSKSSLVQDAVGVAALVVMLVAALHMPGFF